MIDLGLARIGRLLQYTPQPWKAIHVAGTNGKGSICAYLSAMLHASGVSCASFTSPHLIDRWDCITINESPVSEALFRDTEALIHKRNQENQIGASEFELLTATAFEIFYREKVEYGVVEVGLGGKLDATNALTHKAVTVISKIGLDHQGFLGDTLTEIALHKAGIIRRGVPCVVDNSNKSSVLKVIEGHAEELGATVLYPSIAASDFPGNQTFEPHQIQNLACAFEAFRLACPDKQVSLGEFLPVIKQVAWPGRLQPIDIGRVTGQKRIALLDGAHNTQSAEVLAAYVDKHLRASFKAGITWVLAASAGKDLSGILKLLLHPDDRVCAVKFGPVDGMPWVKAEDSSAILNTATQYHIDSANQFNGEGDIAGTLKHAAGLPDRRPIVIAGSLYLVSDVLRLLRDTK
ncbi:uncharacterized protein E0L32_008344 [Thyridium curvatum]|uniref:Uncharacterized protein n=1 Tax=Thyridium curvatum TaxID=1093900 RepID=A0A507AK40_9PEZI|nr:uncharacterized protein E0L32_008344 [Thyridium curvatum]TPX10775.1 hypothetical protein E0L32_008344 [Thyridium curvatum]